MLTVDSPALRGNHLGDPSHRTVALHLPPDYDRSGADYPLFVVLAGYGSSGLKYLAWRPFGESLPQRIERLVAEGSMGPVVTALPDGFTSLGGNQYVDSPVTGNWERFLIDDMVPEIERRFRVRRGPSHRAVLGKSSGGYGALVQGLRHGEQWAGVACHSGDIDFDLAYRRDLVLLLEVLARDATPAAFVQRLRGARKIDGRERHALMLLAMAASYDPDPDAPLGLRLPLDPYTATLDAERWSRWLSHDPLRLIESPACQRSLRSLRGLFLDCGRRDSYFLHHGARAFARRLAQLGLPHRYEEFDDDHSEIDYRLDVSLPFLYRAVVGESASG
jgi:enterochelin esterase-like enzyme